MKRATALVVVGIACAALSACQPGGVGLTEQDKAAIRSVDEPVRQGMITGKPDWSTLVAMLYAPDIELLPPGEPTIKGLDAARAYYSGWPLVKDFTPVEVRLDGAGRFAYRQVAYSVTLDAPGAPAPVVRRGKDIVVLRKEADGTWKIVAEIWNDAEPQAEIAVPTAFEAPDASAEVRKLRDIVGRWKLVGTWKTDPAAAAGPVDLTLTCDWFTGGRQVVYQLDGTIAGEAHDELGAYFYDPKTRAYGEYGISSRGGTPIPGVVTIKPGTWVHAYEVQVSGKPATAHFTLLDMTASGGAWTYEVSTGGGPWTVLGEGKYTAAK